MRSKSKNTNFELANNLKDVKFSVEEKFNDAHESSIEKIHIENHIKALTEEIRDIENLNSLDFSMPEFAEDQLWNEIEEAIHENDVLDLRANLADITSKGGQSFDDIQIDQYLDNELGADLVAELEAELLDSKLLQDNVHLHQEVNEAVGEADIMMLRNTLSTVMHEESTISAEKFDEIDDFLIGAFTKEEAIAFETELASDFNLNNEVSLQSEINDAILEDDVMNLRASLKEIVNDKNEHKKQFRLLPGNRAKLIGAAASVAAVVSIGALTFNQKETDFNSIYQKNYQPYDATGFFRSGTSVTDIASLGVDLYNRNDFQSAIQKFNDVLKDNQMHPMCNFYSGLSNQQLENYQTAILHFSLVIEEKDNLYVEQAEWYMALCLLKTEEKTKGIKLMNDIANSKSYYKENAKDLLRKIH